MSNTHSLRYYPNRKLILDTSLMVHCRNGIFLGSRQDDVLVFRGIPYAKPTIETGRWKKAEKAADCSDLFQAYSFGKICMQPTTKTEPSTYYEQGEDCLTLNVWKSDVNTSLNKAVIVFFHGGNFTRGGTSDPLYDGFNFVHNNPDIVFVSVNYRIGLLGFFDASPLKDGDKYEDSLNLSFWDMILSLQWIQENISSFGGTPKNITIFGHSSGAGMVSFLAILPQAKGLFHRIIAQSGSSSLCQEKAFAEHRTEKIKEILNVDSIKELLDLSEDELRRFWQKNAIWLSNAPTKNSGLISGTPLKDWENGFAKDYDVLQGFCSDECRYFIKEYNSRDFLDFFLLETIECITESSSQVVMELCKKYLKKLEDKYGEWGIYSFMTDKIFVIGMLYQAYYQAKNGGRSFVYQFDYPTLKKECGACHFADLYFVLGNFDNVMFAGTEKEKKLSRIIQKMWANFARTGNPSTEEYNWEEYDCDKKNVMFLGDNIHLVPNPEKERMDELLKLAEESEEIKYNVTSSQIFERIFTKYLGTNTLTEND